MEKYYKPGDKVQFINGGPVMTVQRYVRKYNPWIGWHESDEVECSWYDVQEGYVRKAFPQTNLLKTGYKYTGPGKYVGNQHAPDHKS